MTNEKRSASRTVDILRKFVKLVVEQRKMREADISDGSRVKHGSSKHIKDLEKRIADLSKWRDSQRKGSESRANYARLISRLKNELASAKRASEKTVDKKIVK
jgi:RNA polymerase-interacting CarD/CdnL/TRCF family regulator